MNDEKSAMYQSPRGKKYGGRRLEDPKSLLYRPTLCKTDDLGRFQWVGGCHFLPLKTFFSSTPLPITLQDQNRLPASREFYSPLF
ncbi:hypothetical protein CEXT_430921 [Caerostris extrusa]|uniref:Uncharacterized protein n=1 Tax=Caerostris extrusa TaxID=172846 RepID=A0AAV4VV35_CAEEX|nr:hypothetical protein CEXT_430921 [Caerostris extrusa]